MENCCLYRYRVSFPMNNMVIFHSYVNVLPEGLCNDVGEIIINLPEDNKKIEQVQFINLTKF